MLPNKHSNQESNLIEMAELKPSDQMMSIVLLFLLVGKMQ